jgi:hypothetical protein
MMMKCGNGIQERWAWFCSPSRQETRDGLIELFLPWFCTERERETERREKGGRKSKVFAKRKKGERVNQIERYFTTK